jgi:hypothetical protein
MIVKEDEIQYQIRRINGKKVMRSLSKVVGREIGYFFLFLFFIFYEQQKIKK